VREQDHGPTLLCKSCGEANREAAAFCRRCGASLSARTTPVIETRALSENTASDSGRAGPSGVSQTRSARSRRTWFAVFGVVVVATITTGVLFVTRLPVTRLPDRDGTATSIAVSKDGRYVAIGSARTIRLLDLVSGTRVWRIGVHGQWVACLDFAPNTHSLVAGAVGADGSLSFLDFRTGKVTRRLTGFPNGVGGIRFSPDGLRVVGETGEFRSASQLFAVDTESGKELWRHPLPENEHDQSDHLVSVSNDGQVIATGGKYRTIPLWSIRDGAKIGELGGHSETVTGVAYSPDGTRMASASTAWEKIQNGVVRSRTTGTVIVWKIGQGHEPPEELQRLSTPVAYLVMFSPDGRKLVVKGTNFGGLYLYDLSSGQPVWGASWTPTAVSFLPDGSAIVAAGDDGRVELIDSASGKGIRLLEVEPPLR
jgi:WD40 repeat protein